MIASSRVRRCNRIMPLSPRHQNVRSATSTRGLAQCMKVQKTPTATNETVDSTAMASSQRNAAEDGTEERFSLTRSVHLAHFAFAAYLKPTDNRVYSAIEKAETDEADEIGACQTVTRFFSSQFISQSFEAVVTLTIVSADGLRRADLDGMPDPYVVVRWRDTHARTTRKDNTRQPNWQAQRSDCNVLGESITFWPTRSAAAAGDTPPPVQFTIMDRDQGITADDKLAEGELTLPSLTEELTDEPYCVQLSGGVTLNVKLSVHPVPKIRNDASGASDDILTSIHNTHTAVAIDMPPANIRSRDEPLFMTQVKSAPDVKPKAVAADANNIDAAAVVDADNLQLAWQKVRNALPESPLQRAGRLAFIDVPKTHTQVWLYWRRSETLDGDKKPIRQIVVSFRGTEGAFLKDIITDIRIIKQELPPPEDTNDVDIEIDGNVRVHRGFLAAVRSVAPKVKEILALAIPQEQDSGWTVSVTGHSLGAALATLFAYDLKTDPDWRNRVDVNAMTFASPRVGNEAFSSAFNQLVGNSWRVLNDDDLVPMVPFWFGYHHVYNGVVVLADHSKEEVGDMQKPLLAMLNSRAIDISGLAPERGNANAEQVLEAYLAPQQQVDEHISFWDTAAAAAEMARLLATKRGIDLHLQPAYLRNYLSLVESVAVAMAKSAGVQQPESTDIVKALKEAQQLLKGQEESEKQEQDAVVDRK